MQRFNLNQAALEDLQNRECESKDVAIKGAKAICQCGCEKEWEILVEDKDGSIVHASIIDEKDELIREFKTWSAETLKSNEELMSENAKLAQSNKELIAERNVLKESLREYKKTTKSFIEASTKEALGNKGELLNTELTNLLKVADDIYRAIDKVKNGASDTFSSAASAMNTSLVKKIDGLAKIGGNSEAEKEDENASEEKTSENVQVADSGATFFTTKAI